MDTTLKDLFESHRLNIQNQIEKETENIKRSIQQLHNNFSDVTADLARRTITRIDPANPQSLTNILWVDDHPENNAYEAEVLRKCGAKIDPVKDTADALRKLQESQYDLVISDVGRDGNNRAGLDMLTNIRATASKTPVIFYATERARNKFAEEASRYGASFTTRAPELFAATHARIGLPPAF
jgi:CheY-like chemotaxis protein